jgi:four helix bundle protein
LLAGSQLSTISTQHWISLFSYFQTTLAKFPRNLGGIPRASSGRMQSNDGSFRGLTVWQAAMNLVVDICSTTVSFPREERCGLTSQLRDAGVSIASNIGEGKRRKRQKAYLYHLVALGSQGEVEVQLEIAKRVGYLSNPKYDRLQRTTEEVGKMLNGLIDSMDEA